MAATAAPLDLPVAERDRWQPLRAGLVNLYRYDDEEFRFTDGRLLLRGNNGTGKTRVLALTLPFLLDGEVRPGRVEPDGDNARRFEWHLLMDRFPERTGYSWLELGRREPDGCQRYLTIGCGLRAAAGHQGLRGKWFFVTEERVGSGLSLVADGAPRSYDRLKEHLAGRGVVYDTAQEYRAAVDDHLYQLGEQRYRALVDLLIELRRPQLSRDLDEGRLSRALSDALPELDRAVLDDVAESYRDLERERQGLTDYEETARAVAEFGAVYRGYVEVAAARLADVVRSAHTRYDNAQREVRDSQQRLADVAAALASASERLGAAADERHSLEGRKAGLESSETMRQAGELRRLQEQAQRAAVAAQEAEQGCKEAEAEHAKRSRGREAAVAALSSAEARLEQAHRDAREVAQGLGVAAELDEAWREGWGPLARERLSRSLSRLEEARRQLVACEAEARGAAAEAEKARQRLKDVEARRDQTQQALEAAEDAVAGTRARLEAEIAAHHAGLRECRVDRDALEEPLSAFLDEPEGAEPYAAALNEAAAARVHELAHEGAAVEGERRAHEARMALLEDEAVALRAGREIAPPPPAHRRPDARAGRPGAPLWAVCDFVDGMSPADRAGLEAALEASGLLDAWIHPDGRVEIETDGDACFVDTQDAVAGADLAVPNPRPHLGQVLRPTRPAPDYSAHELPLELVERALASVGLAGGSSLLEASARTGEAATCWVSVGGGWRNGPLCGAHGKAGAQYIGAATRAAMRLARLTAIEEELRAMGEQSAALAARLRGIEERRACVDAERRSAPSSEPVRDAWLALRQRRTDLTGARELVAAAQQALEARVREAEVAAARYAQIANDCGLAAWVERLLDLADAVHAYRRESELLELHFEHRQDCRARLEAAAADAKAAAEIWAVARARAGRDQAFANRVTHELRAIEESQGAAVAELLAQIAHVSEGLRRAVRQEEEARSEREIANEERIRAESLLERAREQVALCEQARAVELDRLRGFAAAGLLAPLAARLEEDLGGEAGKALVEGESTDTAVLELARAIARLAGERPRDAAAFDRLQSRVNEAFQRLHSTLSTHDYLPQAEIRHGVLAVRVPFLGRDCDLVELERRLQDEILQRRQLLTAREREVIENFLLDEAAAALHELLHRAEEWVADVNRELSERPMSTGMALRFEWTPLEGAGAGLREARDRLLRPLHAWSPQDREALGVFLQRRIQAVRDEMPGSTWQEQLDAALDYRTWHEFVIQRRQEGRWTRLTRRTHGTSSGGEKAVALTLPLFAAAAAHYHASPRAPRLILLDEAFVGIDSDMRRNCMGLLAAFDLDVVMTSEREWGCYDTVPGLSIYQLAADPGSICVATTRYVWNGKHRVRSAAAGESR